MGKKKGQDRLADATPEKGKERDCFVDPRCLEDMSHWASTDARVLSKIFDLMKAALRAPFTGIGKPEPLRYLGPDTWSRRITGEHRLIYVVADDRVTFVQARMHY